MTFKILGLAVSASCLLLTGCPDNDDSSANSTLSIQTNNLERLGDNYNYEGWIISNGEAVSTGVFDIVDDRPSPDTFVIPRTLADSASTFVLTIEPAVDPDPGPSNVHIIAGDFSNGSTDAATSHSAALGTNFARAAGSFILATPSNGNATPNQGIWYLDASSGTPQASLNLPELPEGWTYEGWIVNAEGPLSTGTFTSADMADSDAGGSTAGPMSTPPFPGQDFINPAMSLLGTTAVISVEPVPDNDPAPFSIKPLLADIDSEQRTLTNIAANNLPSATVIID